jgi:hypothetical protein
VTTTERSTPSDAPRRSTALDEARARAVLDQEERLVIEAIQLVAGGGSPRVTVAGLRYPEPVIEAARPLAIQRRVRLVTLWTDDERGADVAVEAIEAYIGIDEAKPGDPVRPAATIRAAARGGA